MYKPENYSTVSPYLIVGGVEQVIEFLKEVFGATSLRRYDNPDGTINHAEVRIEDSVIMMGEAGGNWPAEFAHLHVYVNNVDEVYERALRAGAVSVQKPVRKGDDPDKRGGVKGPSGNTWWISTQIEQPI